MTNMHINHTINSVGRAEIKALLSRWHSLYESMGPTNLAAWYGYAEQAADDGDWIIEVRAVDASDRTPHVLTLIPDYFCSFATDDDGVKLINDIRYHSASIYDEEDARGPWLTVCPACVSADDEIAAKVRDWHEADDSQSVCCCCGSAIMGDE